MAPVIEQLSGLADVLGRDASENDLHEFLVANPGFVLGLFGFADSRTLAFFNKPAIGTRFVADFGVLMADQGASCVGLVEIERASTALFTQQQTPAKSYQTAIGQVTEWRQWIEPNQKTFVSDLVAAARDLPEWPDRSSNGSFRTMPPDRLEQWWRAFGGDTAPSFSYVIACGRWALLSKAERERLTFLNSKANPYQTVTYDQIARRAYRRPLTNWGSE